MWAAGARVPCTAPEPARRSSRQKGTCHAVRSMWSVRSPLLRSSRPAAKHVTQRRPNVNPRRPRRPRRLPSGSRSSRRCSTGPRRIGRSPVSPCSRHCPRQDAAACASLGMTSSGSSTPGKRSPLTAAPPGRPLRCAWLGHGTATCSTSSTPRSRARRLTRSRLLQERATQASSRGRAGGSHGD
jgi:hypothetical protein